VVKVSSHKAASPPHVDGSMVFARWRQCTPHIHRKPKMVAMATSLKNIDPENPPPIIKQRVARYHTTEKQKVFAMATSLMCRYRQYVHSVGRPLKPSFITNCVVAVVDTKPVNSSFSPKNGCHGNDPLTLDLGHVFIG